ncbi:MAG: hypothetical protein JSR39_04945 [Verrucomicrobia bacterium]|nr:hypothetical protein [Verrucomicrobiota bacterium]
MSSGGNPTGGVGGGQPSNVSLRLTQAGPQKQYFTYKGKTYMVQAMQKNASTGQFTTDITPDRDWTEAGKHAMEAADKVFQKENVKLAEVKTIHVPLTGTVNLSSTPSATALPPVNIGDQISWSRTVTNTPEETPIDITLETRALIQAEISKISNETAQWRDPTKLYTQTDQSGSAASTRTQTPPQSTPTEPPSASDSTATIPLPPLTFTGPAPYTHDREAALSSFLKSQQTGGAASSINSHQQHLPATAAISAQLAQFNPAVNHTPEDLHKGASKRISEHISDFANDPTDSAEMFTALQTLYSAPTSTPERIKELLEKKSGFAWPNKINDQDYRTLQQCLANKNASELSSEDRIIVAKAFANLIHNTPHTDTQSYPKVYFKAMHAFYDKEKVGGYVGGFGGTEQGSGKSLVIVERTDTGDYKIWGRWPDSGILRPDQTAFVLYDSNATGGKFSGFSRTTGMDARDPLEPARPQTGVTARPSYYTDTDEQGIETGGEGNCGALALADAILQKLETYFRTKSDWEASLKQQKVGIRNNAMRHLFERADNFTTDQLFPEVLSSIIDSKNDIFLQQRPHAATLRALLDKPPGTLLPAEKKWLVQLYAVYAANEGKDLDKPFFLAHAALTGQKIAIIQDNKIVFTAPPAREAITADDYLFVHYNGSNHFKSVNRNYTATVTLPSLNDIVSQYNSENAYLYVRSTFLNSFSNPSTIPEKLADLKAADPHGYLTLQQIASATVVDRAAEGHAVEDFITALEAATDVESGHPVELAAAIELQIKTNTALEARAKFLKALIEARTTVPAPAHNTPVQHKLIDALKTLKKDDIAGYLIIRTQLPTFDFDNIDYTNRTTDMTRLIAIDLNISTVLDGTEPTTVPVPFATEELRQKEIAKRKGLMMIEGGKGIAGILDDPNNAHLKVRAEFFEALKTAPTGSLTEQIDELAKDLSTKDPYGYFAFKAYRTSHPDIPSWEAYVASVMTAIVNPGHDEHLRIKAQADIIKAVLAEEEIDGKLHILKHDHPQDYLALEIAVGKGELPPRQMSLALKEIKDLSESALSNLTHSFAASIHSPATKSLHDFLVALSRHIINERRSTGELRIAYEGGDKPDNLKNQDYASYLAIEDLYLKATDKRDARNSLVFAGQHEVAEIKKAIADSRTAMTARVGFLNALKAAKESPTTTTTPALQKAISMMQQDDIHGFLGLVEKTKKTQPNEIAAELLKAELSLETVQAFIAPNSEGPLENTIYDPALLARANLMQAARKEPHHAITAELWTAVKDNDPLGALILGQLIYEIDRPTDTDYSATATQIAYGKAKIEEKPERIAEISQTKWNEFVQLLATKKATADEDDLEPIGT